MYFFRERGREGEGEREKERNINAQGNLDQVPLYAPIWVPVPQLRPVP